MENKSLIGILLQNMNKNQRVAKMKDLLSYVVGENNPGNKVTVEGAIAHLGLRGRIIDVVGSKLAPQFSDETKSMIFINKALNAALICPIYNGKLNPNKSVSYDHIQRVSEGGLGEPDNGDLVHPYCNTEIKN
jgi:hypothetical protein